MINRMRIKTDDASLILFALKERLKVVIAHCNILKASKDRELWPDERSVLPDSLRSKTREELISLVDDWDAVANQINLLILEFDKASPGQKTRQGITVKK